MSLLRLVNVVNEVVVERSSRLVPHEADGLNQVVPRREAGPRVAPRTSNEIGSDGTEVGATLAYKSAVDLREYGPITGRASVNLQPVFS